MKKLNRVLATVATAVFLLVTTGQLVAQDRGGGRGNFDPEEFRARMMDRYREQLGVKDDAEWKIIEARIEKVNEARRELGSVGFRGRGRGPGGPGGPGGGGGRRGNRGGGGEDANPEVKALGDAVEANAPAAELKEKLAKVRKVRKEKQAALESAQAELAKVLSLKQESMAVLAGLVP